MTLHCDYYKQVITDYLSTAAQQHNRHSRKQLQMKTKSNLSSNSKFNVIGVTLGDPPPSAISVSDREGGSSVHPCLYGFN